MPKQKLTCKKIKHYKKDEEQAAKEYKLLGLKKLASDEAKHRRFFEKEEKKRCA